VQAGQASQVPFAHVWDCINIFYPLGIHVKNMGNKWLTF